jgi:hypothetical protein
MFYEYALDPALLSNWKDCRYFLEKFGWDQGRLIACYPGKWKKQVYESLSGCRPVEKNKIEEKLRRIDNRLLKRPNSSYQGGKIWFENALVEHGRIAFRAIISNHQNPNDPKIIHGDTLEEDTEPLFQSPDKVLSRRAEEYGIALSLLLCSSKRILFVDPYFDPTKRRFRKVLESLLTSALFPCRRETICRLELHTSIERFFRRGEERKSEEEEKTAANLVYECQRKLPEIIPAGYSLFLYIRKEKSGGDEFHNRYVLTEKIGVAFGTGLDEAENNPKATDDLHRLSNEQYSFRWQQYAGENPAFEPVGQTIEIIGVKSIPGL